MHVPPVAHDVACAAAAVVVAALAVVGVGLATVVGASVGSTVGLGGYVVRAVGFVACNVVGARVVALTTFCVADCFTLDAVKARIGCT